MPKDELELKVEEQRYKGSNHLVRMGVMFIQQYSCKGHPLLENELKSLACSYNGVFSRSSTLGFYTTAELKTEINRRSGRRSTYNKEERKKNR